MTDRRPSRSLIPWWSPHPAAIAAGLYAGAVCFGFQAVGALGMRGAEFGIPLVYRRVLRTGGPNLHRFDPGALAVDVLLSALATVACAASAQVFANLMVGRRRLTLRGMMILVALVALPMGLSATFGPVVLAVLAPVFMLATVLVFGAPFALALFGSVMALEAAAGYLSRDLRRPADRGDSPS